MLNTLRESWRSYKWACGYDRQRAAISGWMWDELQYQLTLLRCHWFGHRMVTVRFYVEYGGEELECSRCDLTKYIYFN